VAVSWKEFQKIFGGWAIDKVSERHSAVAFTSSVAGVSGGGGGSGVADQSQDPVSEWDLSSLMTPHGKHHGHTQKHGHHTHHQ
jgi:hypothetical protein